MDQTIRIRSSHVGRLLGRILKVGVQNFKQGVQGSNVHAPI